MSRRRTDPVTWTTERQARLRELLTRMSLTQAAQEIGISQASASRAAKRYGITVPTWKPKLGHPWKRPWPKEQQALWAAQQQVKP